jgi:hypothetical protein
MQGIFLNQRGEDAKATQELVTKIEQLTLQTPAPIPASHLIAPPPPPPPPPAPTTLATQALPAIPEGSPVAPALPTPTLSPHTRAPMPVLSQSRLWWHRVLFAGVLVIPAVWWIVWRRARLTPNPKNVREKILTISPPTFCATPTCQTLR